jgi:hypothetical protein
MIEVARMLKGRFENVITYLHHRITNASSSQPVGTPIHFASDSEEGL